IFRTGRVGENWCLTPMFPDGRRGRDRRRLRLDGGSARGGNGVAQSLIAREVRGGKLRRLALALPAAQQIAERRHPLPAPLLHDVEILVQHVRVHLEEQRLGKIGVDAAGPRDGAEPRADEREMARDVPRTIDDRDARKDRKSTRLNSSHVKISYAVFCLKKKIE